MKCFLEKTRCPAGKAHFITENEYKTCSQSV